MLLRTRPRRGQEGGADGSAPRQYDQIARGDCGKVHVFSSTRRMLTSFVAHVLSVLMIGSRPFAVMTVVGPGCDF
jgi:hypothetical protein